MTLKALRRLALALCLAAVAAVPAYVLARGGDLFLGFDHQALLTGVDEKDFTASALALGDVSGDGIADIVVGVDRSDGFRNQDDTAGEVAVVFGGTDLAGIVDLNFAEVTFFGATASANLGDGVAVGDIDGDGTGDVIMGAAKADGAPPCLAGGAAYVFYGGQRLPRGTVQLSNPHLPPDIALFGCQEGRLGVATVAGDFDGDGFDDFAVSAPQEGKQFFRTRSGVVYVFFGQPAPQNPVELTITPTNAVRPPFTDFRIITILGPSPDARAGRALAAGDVNGDGKDDLLIGTVVANFGRVGSGEVYILLGGNPALEPDVAELVEVDLANPAHPDVIIRGPRALDNFAQALGVANIDGDGAGDILVGAPTAEVAAPGLLAGRAYAVLGRAFPRGVILDLATDPADVSLAGPHDRSQLGTSVSGGDMNADGFDEWIVGAPRADVNGQAYRLIGQPSWPRQGAFAFLTQGQHPGDRAGAVTVVGDVSGDDIGDLVVSSPQWSGLPGNELRHGGAVWVVPGEDGEVDPNPPCLDNDGDGIFDQGRTCGPKDCDDNDPNVGICDPSTCVGPFPDGDKDGWPSTATSQCVREDCDDTNPAIHPGAPEVCDDEKDNDCDGRRDGADTECGIVCDGLDNDGDGWPRAGASDCTFPDCNDENPAIHPGVKESGAACSDGIDNDCDGDTDGADTGCGGGGGGGGGNRLENCKNCVDDDGDGKTDMLDSNCDRTAIELSSAVLRRPNKASTTIKKLEIKTSLPDAVLFSDVRTADTAADGADTASDGAAPAPAVVMVGLVFPSTDNGPKEMCLELEEVPTQRKKNKMTFRSTAEEPKARLRVKRSRKGQLKIKYKQKGVFELPEVAPREMSFGPFSPSQPYGGVTPLKQKGKKLIAVRASEE
jgi:hypothetical protein